MNLTQINLLWEEYKSKYDIDSDAKITAVKYDTDKYVEGCFNLLELMDGEYILHLNPNVHLYSENYVKFILFHEFTHFYDFIHCPYEEKLPMIMWMNAYSEYHACRVTLARFIESLTLTSVHMDKAQLPGPYREISIRHLLIESVYRTKIYFDAFFKEYHLSDFAGGFRNLMYLFGYLSLFQNDDKMVDETLTALHINDELFHTIYQALKDMDFDKVIEMPSRLRPKGGGGIHRPAEERGRPAPPGPGHPGGGHRRLRPDTPLPGRRPQRGQPHPGGRSPGLPALQRPGGRGL